MQLFVPTGATDGEYIGFTEDGGVGQILGAQIGLTDIELVHNACTVPFTQEQVQFSCATCCLALNAGVTARKGTEVEYDGGLFIVD